MPEPPDPHRDDERDPFLIPPNKKKRDAWHDGCQGCSPAYHDAAEDFWDAVGEFFENVWGALKDLWNWAFGSR